jgi:hypothetical protein
VASATDGMLRLVIQIDENAKWQHVSGFVGKITTKSKDEWPKI